MKKNGTFKLLFLTLVLTLNLNAEYANNVIKQNSNDRRGIFSSQEQQYYITIIGHTGSGNPIYPKQMKVKSLQECLSILKASKMITSNGGDSEGAYVITCGGKLKRGN